MDSHGATFDVCCQDALLDDCRRSTATSIGGARMSLLQCANRTGTACANCSAHRLWTTSRSRISHPKARGVEVSARRGRKSEHSSLEFTEAGAPPPEPGPKIKRGRKPKSAKPAAEQQQTLESNTKHESSPVSSMAIVASSPPAAAANNSLEQEIAFQEKEADLSLDDVLQWQFDAPSDDDEDEEELRRAAAQQRHAPIPETPQPSTSSFGSSTSRKGAILLEFIRAGPQLDAKLAEFQDEVDEEMLSLLATRVEMARNADLDSPLVSSMEELYRILSIVHQRTSATPAMRLLDDVLDILGDEVSSKAYNNRRVDAMARMRDVFTGGTAGVDIFAAAAALADAQALAAEQLAMEYVPLYDFMSETTTLLTEVRARQEELGEAIEALQKEVEDMRKQRPQELMTQEGAQKVQQLQAARQYYAERDITLTQLDDVLMLARNLELQLTREGQLMM